MLWGMPRTQSEPDGDELEEEFDGFSSSAGINPKELFSAVEDWPFPAVGHLG